MGKTLSVGGGKFVKKTHVTQNVDCLYGPILGLPPRIPPSDTAADLRGLV
jgi:hypothetical protein